MTAEDLVFPQLTRAEMFFLFFLQCHLTVNCFSAGMMLEFAISTRMNSSSRKNNMPLSISQNSARSHNTTQHVIIRSLSFAFSLFCLCFCVPPPHFQFTYLITFMPNEPVEAVFLGPVWVVRVIAIRSRFTQLTHSTHTQTCVQYARKQN